MYAPQMLMDWMQEHSHAATVSSHPKYRLPEIQEQLRSILNAGANPNTVVPEEYKTNFDNDMRGYIIEAMYKHRPLRMCIFVLLEYGVDPYLTLKGKSVVEKVAQKVAEGTKDVTVNDLHARFLKMKITAALPSLSSSPTKRKI